MNMPQGSPPPDEQDDHEVSIQEEHTDLTHREPAFVSHDANVPVLDTAKFNQMWRVAQSQAESAFVPQSLRGAPNDNGQFIEYPLKRIIANCFKVVNQAVRWEMDPYALLDCASVHGGKILFEGKVIAAVLSERYGIDLDYDWTGEGDKMEVTVTGSVNGNAKSITGSVVQWKTDYPGSPWIPHQYQKQLAYRGAREWARLYKPSAVLGIYGDDEKFNSITTPPRAAQATLPTIPKRDAVLAVKSDPVKKPKKKTPSKKKQKPKAEPKAEQAFDLISSLTEDSKSVDTGIDLRNLEAAYMSHIEEASQDEQEQAREIIANLKKNQEEKVEF